jgi:rifampicin phosphotransferase
VRYVVSLDDLGRDDLAVAGGKGANLGELVRAGLSVPEGFVVTTDAYASVISPLDLKIVERVGGGEAALIRREVEAAIMPAEMRAAIADAYADLGAGPVAVRSSATAEDLPGAAFAGQHDTYVNVVGEPAVIDAVRGAGHHCGPTVPSHTAAESGSIPRTSRSRLSYSA